MSLSPIGDHVLSCPFFKKSEKRSMSHNARVANTDESRRERRHVSSHVRAAASLCFFFRRRRLEKFHSHRLLRGRREP